MKRLLFIIILLSSRYAVLMAQSSADSSNVHISLPERAINLCEKILHALTIENNNWEMALYPAASYSGRTGLSVGVMPMMRIKHDARPWTTITPSFLVSTKGMFEVQCDADIYPTERSTITAKAEFYYLPDDFYNIGNERHKNVEATMNVYQSQFLCDFHTKFIGDKWQIGLTADVCHHNYKKIDGADSARVTINYAEGWNNGFGPLLVFDSRDDKLYARRGTFLKIKFLEYGAYLGGEHNYGVLTFDIRRYFAVAQQSTFALQLYAQQTTDRAPFHHQATFAGTRLARAIDHNLKYVDRSAWLAQGEFRFPLFWRVGAVAWAAAGNVAHRSDKLFYDSHLMAGAGLRFRVFKRQNLNLRLDGGVSSRGESAIYFNIREAF